jgi:hypothetical protein
MDEASRGGAAETAPLPVDARQGSPARTVNQDAHRRQKREGRRLVQCVKPRRRSAWGLALLLRLRRDGWIEELAMRPIGRDMSWSCNADSCSGLRKRFCIATNAFAPQAAAVATVAYPDQKNSAAKHAAESKRGQHDQLIELSRPIKAAALHSPISA